MGNQEAISEPNQEAIPEPRQIETTIKRVQDKGDHYEIRTSPACEYMLCLYKNHPKFIELYNKLHYNTTHRVTYEVDARRQKTRLVDIEAPRTYTVHGILKDFLDIQIENFLLEGYYQLMFEHGVMARTKILISEDAMKGMVIGNTYSVSYVKAISDDYYTVVNVQ